MEDEETTNPVEGEIAPETEVEAVEPQLDDDGNPIEEQPEEEEEFEEIERDGKKAKVPAWLKPELMMNADYTRKTQELAEARRSFETERATIQQADAAELQARGHLATIDGQLSQYAQINWAAWRQQAEAMDAQNFDSTETNKLNAAFQQYTLLKDGKQQVLGYLHSRENERQSKQQQAEAEARQAIAKLLDEGTPELKAEIKDWGRDKAAKLVDATMRNYGFTREDLGGIDDARLFRVMNDAAAWRDHQAKTKKAQSIQKQQEVQPAAKPGRASAPPGKLDDRLSAEEWVKRRNAELRARA